MQDSVSSSFYKLAFNHDVPLSQRTTTFQTFAFNLSQALREIPLTAASGHAGVFDHIGVM